MEINRTVARAATAVVLGALVLLTGNATAAVAAVDKPASVTAPSEGYPTITVVGTVQAGLEVGCLILIPDNSTGSQVYGLFNGDPKVVQPGAHVKVMGELRPIQSWCQQGTPLWILAAAPV